jgi:hypothetical protein
MTPAEAVERCNVLLAHLWMVRTFLKHADEIQDDEELLGVPRTLYDSIRAVEPAFQRGDVAEYLRRLGGKLPKLRRAAGLFAREHQRVSDHTNFQMASLSLTGCVRQLEEVLAAAKAPPALTPATPGRDDNRGGYPMTDEEQERYRSVRRDGSPNLPDENYESVDFFNVNHDPEDLIRYKGHWVAWSHDGRKVLAANKDIDALFAELDQKYRQDEYVLGGIPADPEIISRDAQP